MYKKSTFVLEDDFGKNACLVISQISEKHYSFPETLTWKTFLFVEIQYHPPTELG